MSTSTGCQPGQPRPLARRVQAALDYAAGLMDAMDNTIVTSDHERVAASLLRLAETMRTTALEIELLLKEGVTP